ncbi:hypothetical protein SNEBB_004044 [Seison nebaliae]|nr:hypothetical protein SNEBB_004044 [Seison nebaliae]
MAIILQVGQCGNQIGSSFFQKVYDQLKFEKKDRFNFELELFNRFFYRNSKGKIIARAVAIDTEGKVIDELLNKNGPNADWCYDESNCISGIEGSGNNWAYGFNEHLTDEDDDEEVLKLKRICLKEIPNVKKLSSNYILKRLREQMDLCDDDEQDKVLITIMSVAGGTGSGLGTRLLNLIHDRHPQLLILPIIVWPFESGEICLQNYNSLFTLTNLYDNISTSIIAIDNEQIFKQSMQVNKNRQNIPTISMNEMNEMISEQLFGFLAPIPNESLSVFISRLSSTISTNQHKILSLRSLPYIEENMLDYTTYNWNDLMKRTSQLIIDTSANSCAELNWRLKSNDSQQFFHKLITISRSSTNERIDENLILQHFSTNKFHSTSIDSIEHFQSFSLSKYEKMITCLINSRQPIVRILSRIRDRASNLFSKNAYVHHYQRYGMEEEDFEWIFDRTNSIINEYIHSN